VGVTLAVVVVVSLGAGIAHAGLGRIEVAGVSALTVHVTAAVIAVPLALSHVMRRRQRPRRTDLSRRTVLRTAGLVAVTTLAYTAQGLVTSGAGLPAARRRATGSYETGSGRPAAMPVTQWFTDAVPAVDVTAYRLEVVRADESMLRVPYADLLARSGSIRSAVLDCTGGWWAEQTWGGVTLDALLDLPRQGSVAVRSVTGYVRYFPATEAGNLMLATHVGGAPISAGHGGPVRLVAPGRRGFWWVKWVDQVRVDARPWWVQSPFPLQ
jgi:DMSO/TMAO reductase YedYZ molybdopterin-dependent catalytic subunit